MKITFKPLTRNRVRCNQTGDIISAAKISGYRIVLFNQGAPPSRIVSRTTVSTKKKKRRVRFKL